METKYTHLLSVLLGFGAAMSAAADQTFSPTSQYSPSLQTCLQQAALNPANYQRTIADLHQQCQSQLQDEDTLVTNTTSTDAVPEADPTSSEDTLPVDTALSQQNSSEWFFTPYKDNYLIFGQMRMDDGSPPFSGQQLDTKFSLGLSFSLFSQSELLDFLDPLRFGYSQLSWWNIADDSSPFTEHNYNPEVYWDFTQPGRPLIGDFPYVDRVGLEHQSNGLGGLDSRSWDRIYAQKTYHFFPQLRLGFKFWQVIGTDWQNDDIEDYLGSGQVSLEYEPNDRTLIRFKVQRGHDVSTYTYQADIRYRRPWLNSAFFLSYHNGYGEALINYNQKASSVRLGLYFPLETF